VVSTRLLLMQRKKIIEFTTGAHSCRRKLGRLGEGRPLADLRSEHRRCHARDRDLCRKDSEGDAAGRSADRAADPV
jgi:hypothetical protein